MKRIGVLLALTIILVLGYNQVSHAYGIDDLNNPRVYSVKPGQVYEYHLFVRANPNAQILLQFTPVNGEVVSIKNAEQCLLVNNKYLIECTLTMNSEGLTSTSFEIRANEACQPYTHKKNALLGYVHIDKIVPECNKVYLPEVVK